MGACISTAKQSEAERARRTSATRFLRRVLAAHAMDAAGRLEARMRSTWEGDEGENAQPVGGGHRDRGGRCGARAVQGGIDADWVSLNRRGVGVTAGRVSGVAGACAPGRENVLSSSGTLHCEPGRERGRLWASEGRVGRVCVAMSPAIRRRQDRRSELNSAKGDIPTWKVSGRPGAREAFSNQG